MQCRASFAACVRRTSRAHSNPLGEFPKMPDSDLLFLSGRGEGASDRKSASTNYKPSKRQNSNEFKGVVKRDWVPTGRIDFATNLSNADPDQPGEFRLLVEEHRIVESIAGNENLEIQW